MEPAASTDEMNGAPRQADRPTRGDQQQFDATAPALAPTLAPASALSLAIASDASSRRNMLSLPSLRGGIDSMTPYSGQHAHHAHHAHQIPQAQAQPQGGAVQPNPFTAPSPLSASSPTRASRDKDNTFVEVGRSSQQLNSQSNSTSKSTSDSQVTNVTFSNSNSNSINDSGLNGNVFTPPASASDSGLSGGGTGNGLHSSQESQLLQLSQLAAAQEKMPADVDMTTSPMGGFSRKRMADGMVKPAGEGSSVSPVFGQHGTGHSRNTSTVSIASTTGSRIGELSAQLKDRLSYAMVKVNHGWQSHNIDQVESMTSRAGSPTSTTSTLHGRHGSSASPRLLTAPHRSNNSSSPPTGIAGPGPRVGAGAAAGSRAGGGVGISLETGWAAAIPLVSPQQNPHASRPELSLAPPVSIRPSQPRTSARRNSNPSYTPTFLSQSYYDASPRTPVEGGSAQGTPRQATARTPLVDPILFSPHQNVREQDAIESLLFMSSPGNSANLKHTFPGSSSSSQPVVSSRTGVVAPAGTQPYRRALPTAQPRKSLPTGRPPNLTYPTKKVGFEKSASTVGEMETDEPQYGSPVAARGTPRRKQASNNDGLGHGVGYGVSLLNGPPRPRIPLSVPSGLSVTARRRPALGEEDIDKMLDRVSADNSSDSDEEILIPVRRQRAGAMKT